MEKIKIAIVGTGGVAEALAVALSDRRGVDLCIIGRNVERLRVISELAECSAIVLEDDFAEADIYILAVSDSAVASLAERLPFKNGSTVVHTAGSVDMSVLRCDNVAARGVDVGVIYPLQSFTAGRKVEMKGVPIFTEVENRNNESVLRCAKLLSDSVLSMSSNVRMKLHLGAVFASNFVNMMFSATENVLQNDGESANEKLDINVYKPLIMETLAKAFEFESPKLAQTGPAKRGDSVTMERHLELLQSSGNGELTETYKIISELIWETSKKM
ncbi:MAG: DUF2520 domain-containing protein [Rikenellaceae bacterium]